MFFDTSDLCDGEIYLRLIKTAEQNKEKSYVPAYYFDIIRCSDNTLVGICDLRVGHNENTKYSGNIGYEIYESYRGNHYASKACRLLYILAKKHNMREIYLTCAPENIASRKTCEYAGAKLVGIVDIPHWHEMYKLGRRKSCKYKIEI